MARWLCWLAALFITAQAQAAVHKCLQADGVVLYTDQPCSIAQSNLALSVSNYASYPTWLHAVAALWHERLQPLLLGFELLPLLAALYGLMSLVCFFAYYRDKQFAIKGLQRTPEARLHLYELLGGWPGGLLAQRLIRHKNRKPSYQLVFWLIVALHLALAGLVLWLINGAVIA
ncbi:MAG: DUF1294 domain-containing protein [Gammaproteobacteria bacterium]|nr:DUF1294 domain-containing protein [Gammaproteobacteria bacterium]MBU0882869.1 DUF1294 domain-containing protein [Gammaproteobacteria bacterium]MBU1860997.1 DUF1294 domain-containing protein [Gammaproteobacteria bacterium]